jgi:DNA-binding CsgD family transcriptional regulator
MLPKETLTPQEKLVCKTVALAKSNKETGRILGLNKHTVRWHLNHAFDKLGVDSRLQLLLLVQQEPELFEEKLRAKTAGR